MAARWPCGSRDRRRARDARAIPIVSRLTGSTDSAIQKAAEECLLYLQYRAEQDHTSQRLVRPSEAPNKPEEVLVRPAGQNVGAETALLLRPMGTNEERT